jgi:hypothetical protein
MFLTSTCKLPCKGLPSIDGLQRIWLLFDTSIVFILKEQWQFYYSCFFVLFKWNVHIIVRLICNPFLNKETIALATNIWGLKRFAIPLSGTMESDLTWKHSLHSIITVATSCVLFINTLTDQRVVITKEPVKITSYYCSRLRILALLTFLKMYRLGHLNSYWWHRTPSLLICTDKLLDVWLFCCLNCKPKNPVETFQSFHLVWNKYPTSQWGECENPWWEICPDTSLQSWPACRLLWHLVEDSRVPCAVHSVWRVHTCLTYSCCFWV